MKIGSKIKYVREYHNLSPEKMSEKLKISVPTYRRLENGEREPKLEELKLICHEFDIDLDFFLSTSSTLFHKNTNHTNGDIHGNLVFIDRDVLDSIKQSLHALVRILDK
ncbi:MAG: helix-turn-helix transcriptional regulator [Saprospiraceae bacterium]